METIKDKRNWLLYYVTQNRGWIQVIGIPLVFMTILWVGYTNEVGVNLKVADNWWGKWGDPILALSTFFVALVIWVTNIAADWEDRLAKKLTVSYLFEGREVIRCERASLTHEGDIRNWGQTLGRQTVGKNKQGRDIYFNYSNTIRIKQPKVLQEGRLYFKLYEAEFLLTSIPKAEELENERDMRNGVFVWREGENKSLFVPEQVPANQEN